MTRFFADSSFFFALLNREPIGKTPTQQQEVLRSRTIETEDAVSDEIVRRLRDEAKTRGEFAKVHPCASRGDVADEKEARLLILGPDTPIPRRTPRAPPGERRPMSLSGAAAATATTRIPSSSSPPIRTGCGNFARPCGNTSPGTPSGATA